MTRLKALLLALLCVFASKVQAKAQATLFEISPVRIHVDKADRIHISYQKECGATFAGFVLRSSNEKELYIGALINRPNGRCLELTPLEEVIVPSLRGSDFAAVTSLNPSTEPVYLKVSPIQNFNQFIDDEEIRFEASYTSQCGTQLGLVLYPTANGHELSVLEGRTSRYENCNRTTKLMSVPHINLAGAALRANTQFLEEQYKAPRYSIRRAQTRLFETDGGYKLYYFRRCTEAPIGLIRQKTDKGLTISVLLARYEDIKCPEGTADRLWTPWPEKILDENALAFAGTKRSEQLVIKRPTGYNYTSDSLTITSYASCQKDVGIVSRNNEKGYAVGILQIQNSVPCNSPLKEVDFTFDWNFTRGVKRDIKPLQLVGT